MITTMPSDQNGPLPRVERSPRFSAVAAWPIAEKIRLVEDTMQPGDVGVLRGPASGRRSQLAVQLASTNAGRRPASGPG